MNFRSGERIVLRLAIKKQNEQVEQKKKTELNLQQNLSSTMKHDFFFFFFFWSFFFLESIENSSPTISLNLNATRLSLSVHC